ncbi:hypothetical protein [Rhodopirellula baltica]|uniref:hypothetical protein n=1 Tax=Rhodopirellula baltica TaxID=265606 RepID=UPI001F40795D|nr:hypothetical protein [Rhodopirellula baltica]
MLAYQPEILTFTALVGVVLAIAVPVLRSFDITRPLTGIIVLGTLVITLIVIGLLNYHDGFPFDDERDGDD